jgi:hypothetical protein
MVAQEPDTAANVRELQLSVLFNSKGNVTNWTAQEESIKGKEVRGKR